MKTKLQCPAPVSSVVSRTAVYARVRSGLAEGKRLVLVSAPAGFGKTTCMADMVLSELFGQYSWLSLDAWDDDPAVFLAYLEAAITGISPGNENELTAVLNAGKIPPADTACSILINRLAVIPGDHCLVFDDFHYIQNEYILRIMDRMIHNIPAHTKIVLITREDPPLSLARLRAHGRITEIRGTDLRFSESETEEYLKDAISSGLSTDESRHIEEKTEGWICALQLAVLALKARKDRTGRIDAGPVIESLTGSNYLFSSYLNEQVFSGLDLDSRLFLLKICGLDRFSPSLCDAVTGRRDSGAVLDRFMRLNLFLVALDEERRWFRFHSLFSDFLKTVCTDYPEIDMPDTLYRAACWYAARDRSSDSLDTAFRYYIAAGKEDEAAGLLERNALDLVFSDQASLLVLWLKIIPEQHTRNNALIQLALIYMHMLRGDLDRISDLVSRLDASGPQQNCIITAGLSIIKALSRLPGNAVPAGRKLAEQAFRLLPETRPDLKSLALYTIAFCYRIENEYSEAENNFRQAIEYGRMADSPVAGMLSAAGLASMHFEHGNNEKALAVILPLQQETEEKGVLPSFSMIIYGMLGEIYYQQYQPEKASQFTEKALRLALLGEYKNGTAGCRIMLAGIALTENDCETARAQLMEAENNMPDRRAVFIWNEFLARKVNLALACADPEEAGSILEREGFSLDSHAGYPEWNVTTGLDYGAGKLYNSFLKYILYLAEIKSDCSCLRDGINLAGRIIGSAEQGRCTPVIIEALLFRYRMKRFTGVTPAGHDNTTGDRDLAEALAMGAAGYCVAPFIEQRNYWATRPESLERAAERNGTARRFTDRILPLLADSKPAVSAAKHGRELVEALSERELEVVAMMAEGLTYKETALRLFISVNTVRFHIKSIYGKLGVENRTRAVNRARELELI
ncbi:MAG: hypothetical protein JW874_05085 [Spirochaetales bacterium]|nr:hypothetical protein [Spirochaetales bacterium]